MTGEIRNPKSEIRKKPEIRMTAPESGPKPGTPSSEAKAGHFFSARFGFRRSDFFRISDFVIRTSIGFRFRNGL
jgi:hypothetical protein